MKDHLQEGNGCGTQRWTHCRRFPKKQGLNCPPKWMVKIMENPHKNGWFWGAHHYFRKHPNIFVAFVGSFECFDVGLTISFCSWTFYLCQFLAFFHSWGAKKPEGAESGSNVTVPLECQSLPLRRVEFWVLAWGRSGCNLIAQRDQASLAAHRTWYFICVTSKSW